MVVTERLHIIPLNYYELLCRVYSHTGMVMNDEHENNVVEYTINYMKNCPEKDHVFCTFWVGYYNKEEVLEVGFLRPVNEHGVLEIWCHVRPESQNKGFGTEAIKGLTRWASSFGNVKLVCAGIDVNNYASQKMIRKAGFEYFTQIQAKVNYQNVYIFNLN